MALLHFNASAIQIEERAPKTYGPLPAGEYEMMIVASTTKATKNGSGSYLELEMQVIGGEHSGRRHWEIFNLNNQSQQAVKIAQEQLAKLCFALGVTHIEDSVEMHDLPFIVTMGIDKKDPARNVIWGYKSAGVAPTATPKVAPAARPVPAAAPAKSARPWG